MSAARAVRIAAAVEQWFCVNQRLLPWRRTYDPYQVWVVEVMAQQTRLEVVVPFFERFVARLPDVHSLAQATSDSVAVLWSGLGYYRRARMLREGAIDVMDRFGGVIPKHASELASIAGIGRYTAGAIASIAFGQRSAAVDGNVNRVLARVEGRNDDPWSAAESLVARCSSPRNLNQGLMELGALICKPRNPLCPDCPVRRDCKAFLTDRIDAFPARAEKNAAATIHVDLFLVRDRRGRILLRREEGALMTSLFHLPHGNPGLLSGPTLDVKRGERLGSFRHSITTRRVKFELIAAELADESAMLNATTGELIRYSGDAFAWVSEDDLSHVPHPSYVAKALRMARNHRAQGLVAR